MTTSPITTSELDPIYQADHTLSDDHEALSEAFTTFFERECPPERVRDAEPHGFDADLWRQLVEMRVIAMGVPENLGGDGAGNLDLVLLTEQWGRHLGPVPLAEAITATRLIARVGEERGSTWLAEAMDGSKLLTIAHHRAHRGRPQLVPAAAVADAVLAMVNGDLVLSPVTERPTMVPNQGRTPLGWCDLAADRAEHIILASGPEADAAFKAAERDWRLLMAGALVGMAHGALDIAVTHARERIAFGVPIGSFQAVAHPLVDVATDADVARRITRKAAWWADTDAARERHLIPMAYLYAEEAAVRAATVGVHTLGGVGFTVESDEQLFFRRAKGWTLVAGDPQRELDEIADLLLGSREPGPTQHEETK